MNTATENTVVFSWLGYRGADGVQGTEERADGKARMFTVHPDGTRTQSRWIKAGGSLETLQRRALERK